MFETFIMAAIFGILFACVCTMFCTDVNGDEMAMLDTNK